MINLRIDEDKLAQTLGASAKVIFDLDSAQLMLHLTIKHSAYPDTLLLELSHPAKADWDRQFILTRRDDNDTYYHSDISAQLDTVTLNQRWYLSLRPQYQNPDQSLWRLRGNINFSKTHQVLLQYPVDN